MKSTKLPFSVFNPNLDTVPISKGCKQNLMEENPRLSSTHRDQLL